MIALIITIIVLIILAGISIVTLTGDNGVLTKANTAKEKTEIEKIREMLEVIKGEYVIEKKTQKDKNRNDFWDKLVENNIITNISEIGNPKKENNKDIYIINLKDGNSVKIIVDDKEDITIAEIGDFVPNIRKVHSSITKNEIKVDVDFSKQENETFVYKIVEKQTQIEKEKTESIEDLSYTFRNLKEGTTYIITIEVTNKYTTSEKTIEVSTIGINSATASHNANSAMHIFKVADDTSWLPGSNTVKTSDTYIQCTLKNPMTMQ